jgi:hypothetical protein
MSLQINMDKMKMKYPGRTLYYRDDFLLLGFMLIFRIQKEDIVP